MIVETYPQMTRGPHPLAESFTISLTLERHHLLSLKELQQLNKKI